MPGDAVLADSGGVFFCSSSEIDEIYETALPMQQREPKERLRGGEKLGASSGSAARVEAARRKAKCPWRICGPQLMARSLFPPVLLFVLCHG
jgi:hypothetical protein